MSTPNPATTDWIPIWSLGVAPLAYGTSLPSSPVDGQEAVLVDSLTNSSYQWRFRYNAGSSSTYKWEYIGGVSASAIVGTAEAVGTFNAWIDLATGGPQFNVPRAGDYSVVYGARLYNVTGAAAGGFVGLGITGKASGNIQIGYPVLAAGNLTDLRDTRTAQQSGDLSGLASGTSIKVMYYSGGAVQYMTRVLEVTPRRVS